MASRAFAAEAAAGMTYAIIHPVEALHKSRKTNGI
jgi:hypothetical protein